MLKRILTVSILLVAFAAAPAFSQSWGVGPLFRGSVVGGFGGDLGISVQGSNLPFTLGIDVSSTLNRIGATADWYAIDQNLEGDVNWYFGPGVYAGLNLSATTISAGARAPLGLYWFANEAIELFGEVTPTLSVISGNDIYLGLGLQPALGLRFWF